MKSSQGMKKIVLLLLIGCVGIQMQAQDTEEPATTEPVSARKKIEAARVGLITERLGLTPEQAEKFWPIYKEFKQKQVDLNKEYRTAQRNINPNNPDPKQEAALVDLGLKIKQQELNLEKDYSAKLMNVITAQQMLNLRQAEKDFRNIIINQLQQRRNLQQRKENFRDKQRLQKR
jgi:hypothetical protein